MKAHREGVAIVTDKKKLVIELICKSAEHTEPLNLAGRQLDSLETWACQGNQHLLEPASVRAAVVTFHPDFRYDKSTRALVALNHGSRLWLEYEGLNFDPAKLEWFSSMAIDKGYEQIANYGKFDHRKLALTISAQLALFEGNGLRIAVRKDPLDVPDLWRRLFWFTRFYRAWQLIAYDLTPSQAEASFTEAGKTRSWKRDSWTYFQKSKAANSRLSVAAIATNFVKLNKSPVGIKEVEKYFGYRLKLIRPL